MNASNWLASTPAVGKRSVPITVELDFTSVAMIGAAMMRNRANLTAIVTHALWSNDTLGEMVEAESPIPEVEGTGDCVECRGFKSSDVVFDFESQLEVAEKCQCIECGRSLN